MWPWCSPAPPKWRKLLGVVLLAALASATAQTSFNQTEIVSITERAREARAPGPAHAPGAPHPPRHREAAQPPIADPLDYLLTVKLGGLEALATPDLIGVTQGTVSQALQTSPEYCHVVEAANITQCVNGAPSPAASTDVYFAPGTAPGPLSAYLGHVWQTTSGTPSPPYNLTGFQHPVDFSQHASSNAGRRLLTARERDAARLAELARWPEEGVPSRRLRQAAAAPSGSCVPESQLTLQITFPGARVGALWNATIDFFVSGRFLAKMQSKGVNLDNAQLLGYQEPSDIANAPAPSSHRGPDRPNEGWHTWGPKAGVPQQDSSPLEFSLHLVGDDAQVTNDFLLGALYSMIIAPNGSPGSAFLTAENTAITVVRQGPPQSVGVALGRRLQGAMAATDRLRRLLQQPPLAPPPLEPVGGEYNVTKPSLDVTFRLASVPSQSVPGVKATINGLVGDNVLLKGFQSRNIKIVQVNLQSFTFQPAAAPQSGPPIQTAPPPYVTFPTRKSSSAPRTTIIVVAVVPVSVLGAALGIFAYFWFKRQRLRQALIASQDSLTKLKARESELSAASSLSDHFSDKEMSASAIIRQMHPPRLSQSAFLDMTWSDWKIASSELTVLTRPDGSEWLLGSGASGRVYKALRNGVQIVAVKLFKEEMTRGAINSLTSPKHAEQFRREISILKSCHDKNIVQFLGAVLTDDRTILVTEFLENGDLYNAINSQQGSRYHWYRMQQPDGTGRPVPNSGMARRVALDVARGLHFLHTKKIVHFDLKSANILLARDFTAKIADVGLARILKDDMLSTRKEVGTFAWAAPEVLLGQRTSEAADIYSFGVLLHELSALESPTGRYLRRLRVPDECPPEVNDLMFRCLDPNQHNRPSARDLVAVLSCLPAVPPFAPPPSKPRDSPAHSRGNSFSRLSFTLQQSARPEADPRP